MRKCGVSKYQPNMGVLYPKVAGRFQEMANGNAMMERMDEKGLMPVLELVDEIETTARAKEQLRHSVMEFATLLYQWSQQEQSLEGIRWRVGDWILHAEARYGEQTTATIAEMVHEFLSREYGLRITLNMVYKAATLARMFPSRYRYPHVPYSVYQILGEMYVGGDEPVERIRRRRELIEAYATLRKEQFIPVDYHAIKAFAEVYLKERYALEPRVSSSSSVPKPVPAPAPASKPSPAYSDASVTLEVQAAPMSDWRWERWRLEAGSLSFLLELRGEPSVVDALAPALSALRDTLRSLGQGELEVQRYPED